VARKVSLVEVGKRRLELTNLDKVLFPADGIVKAELIEYYLCAAPTILRHVKGRPLSLVRFPDGVHKHHFFQKNRPNWAPDWVPHVHIGEVDYMTADDDATLVWLANMACIELHQMPSRVPRQDIADYLVFDLDPPEGYPFTSVARLAFEVKELLERYGYHPFVKTTGGKGVHVVAPLDPVCGFEEVADACFALARDFVKRTPGTTLNVKKEGRAGAVFIDVGRNRTHQTIVSPYSVRGRDGAPVSTPLHWDELERLQDPRVLSMAAVRDRIVADGDPWEGIGAFSVPLHTRRHAASVKGGGNLEAYARKRKFEKTPEPGPEVEATGGRRFVLHRHHATRLHYDLRLERDGVLRCWALPKGLPARPGIKHLAVATEDHPLKYLSFAGTIPKGEYGAGRMWVYATGTYELTKEKKDGFYVRLQSPSLAAEYRMIHTSRGDWLVERLEPPQVDWLRDPVEPMLAQPHDEPFDSADYAYEVKWDGIRALITLDEGTLRIRSRNKLEITARFPELDIPAEAFRATCGLFDAEIVCLDEVGRPVFDRVVRRLQQKTAGAIATLRARYPVVCYLFDCLYLDGRAIVDEPWQRRREWLADAIMPGTPYRLSEAVGEGRALFAAAASAGLEGVMAKRRDARYQAGRRSEYWLKIKVRATIDCVILGFTKGKGDRASTFGALHLGAYRDGVLVYVGKVGTGFDDKLTKTVLGELRKVPAGGFPGKGKPPDEAVTTWIEPALVCEVRYASLSKVGHLREPVFVRLRPDKLPTDCVIGVR
jgi:DNA ligase D-like protein (predicted ligase)/DNA ligase D-like protein (predicted polymerase)/DNA ligase D-like protein (predicted 3'-phosphoesterase)